MYKKLPKIFFENHLTDGKFSYYINVSRLRKKERVLKMTTNSNGALIKPSSGTPSVLITMIKG